MHLHEYLIYHYQKRGWTVLSEFYDVKTSIPGGWTGLYPDLLAIRGSSRVAVCIETDSTVRGDLAPMKWKSILQNPGVSLEIVVRDRAVCDLVLQIAERNGIDLECRIMKRNQRRKRKKGVEVKALLRNRTGIYIMVVAIFIVFIISFLFIPAMRNRAELQSDFYSPFDHERQMETLKKEIKELERKK